MAASSGTSDTTKQYRRREFPAESTYFLLSSRQLSEFRSAGIAIILNKHPAV
jgi:hypothetical protein